MLAFAVILVFNAKSGTEVPCTLLGFLLPEGLLHITSLVSHEANVGGATRENSMCSRSEPFILRLF